MINLLPAGQKEAYRFAQSNHRLLPWLCAFIVSIIGLIAITVFGNITLNQAADNYSSQIASSQASLAKSHLASVKSQVSSISGNLKLVVDVLSRELLFSKLLTRISVVVPNGVNLTGLNINQDDSAINLDANATNYQAATQFQANLTDPSNQIFSHADLETVTCSGAASANTDPTHPCSVVIRAQLATNNQFLFINNGVKK